MVSMRNVKMPRILYFLVILALSGASPLFADSRVDVDGNALYGWCRPTPGGLPSEPVGGLLRGLHPRRRRRPWGTDHDLRPSGLPPPVGDRPSASRDRGEMARRSPGKKASHCPRTRRRSPVERLPLPVTRPIRPWGPATGDGTPGDWPFTIECSQARPPRPVP